MAVSKIWKVTARLDQVIDYATNPEKTAAKDYSPEQYQALADVLQYAKDEEKTEREFYVGGINCNASTARDQFVTVKEQFDKCDGIQAYHGYLSFKDEQNITPELAQQIGTEFAKRVWGDRFQVVVTTHLNTKHLHCHFVVNSVSFVDGKRMQNNEKHWRYFRHIADELCRQHQLEKGIILKFPAFFARTNTALVLKEPKTKTSTRKVFLPKTVAEMLKERYQEIQEYKELFGDEFQDFNLVFCNANGRPMESQIITRALQKLIKDNDLPPVVFHSLRHSSITYKLKLNGGDIKSVQGDSGHAQVKMVTDVYSHIIDEDRRLNAQRFEETFYQKKNPSEVNGATVEPKKEPQGITEEAMLNYMVQNPDFLQKFKVLLGVGN